MTRQDFIAKLEQAQKDRLELLKAKNNDYSRDDDPLANFKHCDRLGVCSVEAGMIVRMSDKLSRVSQLIHKEASVTDEKIYDTLRDLANYADIMAVYVEDKRVDIKEEVNRWIPSQQ